MGALIGVVVASTVAAAALGEVRSLCNLLLAVVALKALPGATSCLLTFALCVFDSNATSDDYSSFATRVRGLYTRLHSDTAEVCFENLSVSFESPFAACCSLSVSAFVGGDINHAPADSTSCSLSVA